MQWWNEKNVISWRTIQRQTQQTVNVSQKTGMIRIEICCEFFKANNTVALNMIEMVIVLLQAYIPTWLRPVGLALGVKSVKVLTVVLKTNWPRADYNYRTIVVDKQTIRVLSRFRMVLKMMFVTSECWSKTVVNVSSIDRLKEWQSTQHYKTCN